MINQEKSSQPRGVQALSSHELLMVLMGSGVPGRDVTALATGHRDYSKDGAKVPLDVFADRIVVKSPGELVL